MQHEPMMLQPQADIGAPALERGIKWLLADAFFATVIGAINSGVVLLAYAIHLGANNLEIGLIAAVPLLTQVLQAPAVSLVERVRNRRLISTCCLVLARLALPFYATIPFIVPRPWAPTLVIMGATLHYGGNAIAACSWNSWMRDLLPDARLGRFFATRTLYATAASMLGTLAAAWALAAAGAGGGGRAGDLVFSGLYLGGMACGVLSTIALARVPEPAMGARRASQPLASLLIEPLRDRNFRQLLRFFASWQFAVNLATPFFTVYFVRGLGLSMSFVLVLTMVSQLATFVVLRGWGQLTDRFSNRSVLLVAAPVYLLCVVGLVLADYVTAIQGRVAYLVALQIVFGLASAGVGLASNNIVMKLSPSGAANYMATNALVSAIAAGIAPILGGWTIDLFARRGLSVRIDWQSPDGTRPLIALWLTHWQFFFCIAALIGVYALHRLALVQEHGQVDPREVRRHIWFSTRRTLTNASSVAGLLLAVTFPGGAILAARTKSRRVARIYEVRESEGWTGALREIFAPAHDEALPRDMVDALARLDRKTA